MSLGFSLILPVMYTILNLVASSDSSSSDCHSLKQLSAILNQHSLLLCYGNCYSASSCTTALPLIKDTTDAGLVLRRTARAYYIIIQQSIVHIPDGVGLDRTGLKNV